MRWVIKDSQVTELDGFNPSILPNSSAKYIRVHVTRNNGKEKIGLEAGPYVGAMPLTNGDTLYIVPRIGYRALSRMMACAEGLKGSIRDEFQDFAKMGYDSTDSQDGWIQVLARSFADSLRLIEKKSLRTERVWKQTRGEYARGKVEFLETVLNLHQKKSLPVIGRVKTKTTDTIENKLLATAAARLVNLGLSGSDDIVLLRRWAELVDRPLHHHELEDLTKSLNTGRYQDSRSYYIHALLIARLILLQGGLTFVESQEVKADVVLVNIYHLFEGYLRSVLRNFFTEKGFIAEKSTDGLSLFTDGTAELQPDIVISDGKNPILLLDAKYKPEDGVTPQDFYQMNTYLDVYGLDVGVLIRPTASNSRQMIVERKTRSGEKSIVELHLSLDDWQSAENFLTEQIGKIIKTSSR